MSHFQDMTRTAVINCSSSGNNTLIDAPSAGRIVIDHVNFIPTGATVITLYSGAGGTALTGPYDCDAKQGMAFDNVTAEYAGLLRCGYKTALVLNSSAATQISGFVNYRIINAD